jgi:hypothetical protein
VMVDRGCIVSVSGRSRGFSVRMIRLRWRNRTEMCCYVANELKIDDDFQNWATSRRGKLDRGYGSRVCISHV